MCNLNITEAPRCFYFPHPADKKKVQSNRTRRLKGIPNIVVIEKLSYPKEVWNKQLLEEYLPAYFLIYLL